MRYSLSDYVLTFVLLLNTVQSLVLLLGYFVNRTERLLVTEFFCCKYYYYMIITFEHKNQMGMIGMSIAACRKCSLAARNVWVLQVLKQIDNFLGLYFERVK